jgi:hypothetical protein
MTGSPFPPAPADLMAVVVGRQVLLAWAEGEGNAIGFSIERAGGNGSIGSFVEIGRVGMHVLAFCDGTVTPRTTYSYRILARNAAGDSPPSNAAEVTVVEEK